MKTVMTCLVCSSFQSISEHQQMIPDHRSPSGPLNRVPGSPATVICVNVKTDCEPCEAGHGSLPIIATLRLTDQTALYSPQETELRPPRRQRETARAAITHRMRLLVRAGQTIRSRPCSMLVVQLASLYCCQAGEPQPAS